MIENLEINEAYCPIEQTFKMISGKWKLIIIWHLSEYGVLRYGELKKKLYTISHKMLSEKLKELQADNFIQRKEYNQTPLKVEYSLTEFGLSFIPVLKTISEWGLEKNLDYIENKKIL